jgi:hypothetical protein
VGTARSSSASHCTLRGWAGGTGGGETVRWEPISETSRKTLRKILAFAAVVEVSPGVALMIDPAIVIALLLGAEVSAAGLLLGRFSASRCSRWYWRAGRDLTNESSWKGGKAQRLPPHGLVACVRDWSHSSFNPYGAQGVHVADCAGHGALRPSVWEQGG